MIQQSGYLYDNAPMEWYFNTLKNELINHYYYKTEKEIYESIEEFAYVWYNHVRPHSYNDYMTPYEKRKSFKKVNKEINFNQMLLLQFCLTRTFLYFQNMNNTVRRI